MPPGRSGDLFGAVRPPQVAVTCFGHEWVLQLGNAHQWISALGYDLETLAGVVPGAVSDSDAEAMFQLALQHPDADRRWVNAARVAVGRAGGRDWWWTVNLSRKLLRSWPYVNGRLLLDGVKARELLLPDFLDAAYMLLWGNADEGGRMKLDLELQMLPKGVAVRQSGQQRKAMMEAFAAD